MRNTHTNTRQIRITGGWLLKRKTRLTKQLVYLTVTGLLGLLAFSLTPVIQAQEGPQAMKPGETEKASPDAPAAPEAITTSTYFSSFGTTTYSAITGTLSTATGDDGAENVTLPFTFKYDGVNYTTARISTNGWLEMGQTYTGTGFSNDLADTTQKPFLAPLWDDLFDDATSEVRYATTGSSPNRVFTVQWGGILWYLSGGTRQNFQVKIYETSNRIEFIYGSMTAPGGSSPGASIGINDATGGTSHFISVTPPSTVSSSTANNAINAVTDLPNGRFYAFTPVTTHTWTGTVSIDWHTAGNWNTGYVPVPGDSIIINSATNQPAISATAPSFSTYVNVTLNSGATLTVASSGTLNAAAAPAVTVNTGGTLAITGGTVGLTNGATAGILLSLAGGTLNVSSGALNVGTISDQRISYNSGSIVNISGGSVTTASRFAPASVASTLSYTQSAGAVLVNTVGSTSTSFGAFDIPATGSSFTMSGGTITLQRTTSNADDYINKAATNNVTGGTVQFGNASTPASAPLFINSTAPVFNLTLGSTSAMSLTLSANLVVKGSVSIAASQTMSGNTFNLNVAGGWTNNGTFTPSTGTVTFDGAAAQAIGGTTSTTFSGLTLNNSTGLTLNLNTTVSGLLTLTSGDITTGSNILTQSGTGNGGLGTADGTATSGDVVGTVLRTDIGATARAFGHSNNRISVQAGTSPTQMQVTLVKSAGTLSPAIKRVYTITPTGGAISAATVRLRYLETELSGSGVTESQTQLYRHNGSAWVAGGVTNTRDTTANWAEAALVTSFSPWVIGGPSAPTLAVLKDYHGYRLADGNLLQWQSSFEQDNLGFRVYRQDKAGRREITSNLVAGSAFMAGGAPMTAGNSYTWWDGTGAADSVYYIEDVDLNGKVTLHGPISVAECGKNAECGNLPRNSSQTLDQLRPASNGTGLIIRQVLPKELRQATGNSRPEPGSDAFAKQLDLAGRQAVKLNVRQAGWYRVSGAQLQAASLPAQAEASFLQLYRNGEQVPLAVRTAGGGDSGALGAEGVVEFYGVGNDTRESDTATYWLIAGDGPGLRVGAPVRVAPGGGDAEGGAPGGLTKGSVVPESGQSSDKSAIQTPQSAFPYTVERKERTLYAASIFNGDAENFFGAVISNTASNQTLRVNRLAPNTNTQATLAVALQGGNDNPHQVAVSLNGRQLGVMSFTGKTRQTARFQVPGDALAEGDNTVTLQALNGSGDVSVTDYLRLTYQRRYVAEDNRLLFSTGQQNGLRITGFTGNDVRVFDLTEPGRYFEVATRTEADGDGYAAIVNSQLNNRQLLAVAGSQALSPLSIEANEPSSWTQAEQEANLLIVTPRALRDAATPLALARRQQGWRVSVVMLEDVFDEWSGGVKDVKALRGFLRYAKEKWSVGPQYVLLLGDASYDPRNYRGFGETDLLPTAYVGTQHLETSSDEALVDFDDDGIGEMSIGRLPARTLAQAQAIVARVVNYTPYQGGALLVADRPDGYNFAGMNEEARNLLPVNMPVTSVSREGQSDATARSQMLAAINAGPSLVQYAGHGSVQVWTSGGILDSNSITQLTNGSRLPLFIAMTCLNGYFHDVASDSLAEGLLKAPNGGASAVWASSAMTEPRAQAEMNRAFIQALYGGNGITLGDAVRQAKAATQDLNVRQTWILFGDPTQRIR